MAVVCLYPCGDYCICNWVKSPNSCFYFQNVCEVIPDNATTFNCVLACNHDVLCLCYQCSANLGTINYVLMVSTQVAFCCAGSPAYFQVNGVDFACPIVCLRNCCWGTCSLCMVNVPCGTGWTWAQVNSILGGLKSCGSCCKWAIGVTQTHLEVNYSPSGYSHSVDGISAPTAVDGIQPPTKVDGI